MTCFYENITGEKFRTTALYENRIKDKKKLESVTDLKEDGLENIYFYTQIGTLIAQGYTRVVYGDHGPYLEFLRSQVVWNHWQCERKDIGYYNKWFSKDGSRVRNS